MNYLGEPIIVSSAALQAQIDVINATLVTLQNEINATNIVVGALLTKEEKLSESAIGDFTPFNFISVALTNITPLMSPSIGEGLFIPLSHMQDGMCLRVTVFVSMQMNVVQDFRFYLAQDTAGNFPYTFSGFEAVPSEPIPQNKKYVFTVMVKQVQLPARVASATESAYGKITYTNDNPFFNPFTSTGGIPIHFLAEWRTAQAVQNFTVQSYVVEKIAFGLND